MQSPSSRGMAFIDFDNIAIPSRNFFNIQYLDFNELRNILLRGYRGVGCNVYLPHKMRNVLGPIQKSGLSAFVVRPGKSIDGRLILDAILNADSNHFDAAIIASGDIDYVPLVNALKRKDKKVIIASFSRNLSHALENIADGVIDLDTEVSNLSARTYSHTCSKCGIAFELRFKFRGPNPLCGNCLRSARNP